MLNGSEIWHEVPVVVVDFETTGIDTEKDAPVEIGIARFDGGELSASWRSFVNPGKPIPEAASAIHGITDDQVADAPLLGAAVSEAIRAGYFDGAAPCAYNAPFDRAFFRKCPVPYGELAFQHPWVWLDPLVVIRHIDKWVGGKGRHKLQTTCRRHGVPLTDAHSAAADAEAVGRLLYSNAFRDALGDLTLLELLKRQEARRAKQEADFQRWKAAQPPMETGA